MDTIVQRTLWLDVNDTQVNAHFYTTPEKNVSYFNFFSYFDEGLSNHDLIRIFYYYFKLNKFNQNGTFFNQICIGYNDEKLATKFDLNSIG